MNRIVQFFLFGVLLFSTWTAEATACTVCHSKDPKMVRMHSAQGYKDCFTCHGPPAKPMDRNKRTEDLRCLPCHK